MTGRASLYIVLICAGLGLAACQSGEERAEAHYQRALELMAEGDVARARVEFLNVFSENGFHEQARADFAAMLRGQGQLRESYSQYLRLVEQYPDHVEGRLALSEMAIEFQSWEEARRHGPRAMDLAPDDPRSAVIAVSLDYAAAVEDEDDLAAAAAVEVAQALLDEDAENLLLLRIEIDAALRAGEFDTALAGIDRALQIDPESRFLNDIRLWALGELNQEEAFEAQLLGMLEVFPEDPDLPTTVLRYFMARGETDRAVAFLRAQAGSATDPETRRDAEVALVQLVLQLDGQAAALAELDRIIAAAAARETEAESGSGSGAGGITFEMLRASLLFDSGDAAAGIAEMRAILDRDLSTVEAGEARVTLARMLLSSGQIEAAQAEIAQVLEADPGQTEALKLQAGWLIEGDDADRAIGLLRTALDNDPDDTAALTLMAEAHARNGNQELAREFFALAVEASGSAPTETLRYAGLLIEDERFLVAEEILIEALRAAPGSPQLLAALGDLYIRLEDWPRAEQVEASLREQGTDTAADIATALETARLAAQGRITDAIAAVEAAAEAAGSSDQRAQIAVVRLRLATGDIDGARAFAEDLVAGAPDVLGYRFVLAAAQSATGDLAAAEESFLALTEAAPEVPQAWLGLIQILSAQGRIDAAEAALQAGLAASPDALDLLWAQASFQEQAGDIDGAIATYERMYEAAPNAPVIANNLASLLATYRDDAESLERAWTVARRLRGLEVAPFQDTYGWISYRRGDFDLALEHLEPAAAGLPDDPIVQYHLGMTYLALGQREAALAQLQHAVDLAGPDDSRPQFEIARTEIAALEAALAAEAEGAEASE
ncbi:MAG: tetratricopeptide repeat protein [Pseudomonadota bacterium]